MSQESAKLSPSRASLAQARNAETTSCPIEIPLDKSPAKVQHGACQTSTFGSGPPKLLSGSKSTHSSPRDGTTWSTSFSTWADQTHSFPFSDADLCPSEDNEVPFLKTAPSPPKPLLPVMPLLKAEPLHLYVHLQRQRFASNAWWNTLSEAQASISRTAAPYPIYTLPTALYFPPKSRGKSSLLLGQVSVLVGSRSIRTWRARSGRFIGYKRERAPEHEGVAILCREHCCALDPV